MKNLTNSDIAAFVALDSQVKKTLGEEFWVDELTLQKLPSARPDRWGMNGSALIGGFEGGLRRVSVHISLQRDNLRARWRSRWASFEMV